MLEDHGIVDWDPEGHEIELLPSADRFEPYLGRTLENQYAWHRFYATAIALGVVAFGVSWLSIGPLTSGLAPIVALALCVVVFCLSVAQYVSRRPDLARLRGFTSR